MSSSSCSGRPDATRRAVLGVLAGAGLAAVCRPVHAAGWRDALGVPVLLGRGEMRWFGLRLYRAALWAGQRPWRADRPYALQLRYDRHFGRARLASASIDEIRRMGRAAVTQATLDGWEAQLRDAFVDVAPDDELTGLSLPGQGLHLYQGERRLAALDDAALARAFFGIWLDPGTRAPALRQALLGEPP